MNITDRSQISSLKKIIRERFDAETDAQKRRKIRMVARSIQALLDQHAPQPSSKEGD